MPKLHLFQGFGVELEYMIVDKDTLKVLPVTDRVLKDFHGSFIDEIENGSISWSNELALHVIELKTNGPSKTLEDLSDSFSRNVIEINQLLEKYNGILLPTAMHPFMDPFSEMKLWPHERNEIYEKYNSIFDCKGHGWANLQSVHINLPFANDEEFEKLHAAIRLILPLLPALAASSPIKDGIYSGFKDTRLDVYQNNQKRILNLFILR
jgi:gamma-glutamyl:cysteine ligase YbdK (ATP-grasp superfamily)